MGTNGRAGLLQGFHGFSKSRTSDLWGEKELFTLACKVLNIAADSVTV